MANKDKESMMRDYKAIFENAYAMMNEPIIEGNCGALCGYHCCRRTEPDGERLGMYLLPLEYEYMQVNKAKELEIHTNLIYDMPPRIKKRYYIYCHEEEGCLRDFRPIQCRTYPFEPHIENGEFSLVVEKNQIHACPLLSQPEIWRPAFIEGIYEGWLELLKIPIIKYFTLYFSQERVENANVLMQYTHEGWKDSYEKDKC